MSYLITRTEPILDISIADELPGVHWCTPVSPSIREARTFESGLLSPVKVTAWDDAEPPEIVIQSDWNKRLSVPQREHRLN